MRKNKKQLSDNSRKNFQMRNKNTSNISSLITQNPKNVKGLVKNKPKKNVKIAGQVDSKNNHQNVITNVINERKGKLNQPIGQPGNNNKVTNEEKLQRILDKKKRKKEKKKLKRLQRKPSFKLDQQTDQILEPTNKTVNLKGEKQVEKDLLNVKSVKISVNGKPKVNPSFFSLREKMQNQLKSSHFRYLNEKLYTTKGNEAKQFFQSDRDSFDAYHEGFRQQVSKWPMNPLDKIIAAVKKMLSIYRMMTTALSHRTSVGLFIRNAKHVPRPADLIIADFGCGEAKLARSVPHKVHSFDLVETVPGVIACDMAHCMLPAGTVDVAVFCLSLMGTNLHDYLAEANRVLKMGGILKIAEVESRFDKVENFIRGLQSFGFILVWNDLSHNLFYFLDFKKDRTIKKKNKLPTLTLHPCLYKKR